MFNTIYKTINTNKIYSNDIKRKKLTKIFHYKY